MQCDDLLFPNQSPIRLDETSFETANLQKLDLQGFELIPSELHLINDGSGLTIRPVYPGDTQAPSLAGGPLIPDRKYILDHIDFHWGTGKLGSEHQIGHEG
jgi:hypothetical protein